MIRAILLLALALPLQEPVVLKHKVKKDDVRAYRLQVDMKWEDSDLLFEAEVTNKVVDVGADGRIVMSSQQSKAKLTHAGQLVPYQTGEATYSTFLPTGQVEEIGGETVDAEDYRFSSLTSIMWPGKPVAKSDTWTGEVAANAEKGTVAVKTIFVISERETLMGKECFKIAFDGREQTGEKPASAKGVIWVEIATGLTVKSSCEMKNAPLAGQVVDAKWEMVLVPQEEKKG